MGKQKKTYMVWLGKWRRQLRLLKRRYRRSWVSIVAGTMVVLAILGLAIHTLLMPAHVDPSVYRPLMNTIAEGESNGNYNAYYGNANNRTIRFTDMTITQVLTWQTEYVAAGHASSAVGRYQIIRPTLVGLINQLQVDPATRFDENLQDSLAVALIERRGGQDFVRNEIKRDQFAANLAQEWAALPRITGPEPAKSYYEGDGINTSRISIKAIYDALAKLNPTQ